MSIISKAGFRVNHEQQRLEQTTATKKDISLEKAKETTKRVPKTEQQKQQAKERMEKKKAEKEKEIKLAKKEGVKEFKQKKAEAEKKKKPAPKPVEKPKKKTSTIGTQTEKPKEEKKKVLAIEDKKKSDKTFKVERTERSKMINQLSQEIGRKFDPFKILGIKASQESPELVKKRCRDLKLINHPDKGGDKEKFDMIQKACDVLLSTQTILKKTEKKTEKKKKSEEKKDEVLITMRPMRGQMVVSVNNIQSSIEKQLPGYEGYDRIKLIKLQQDALKEGKRPTIDILVKDNEGKDLQIQFGVEGSTNYGKRIILKKKKSGNNKDSGDAVKKPVSVKDIFDELVANSDEKILPFTSYPTSSMLMYAEILEKNKNDCSLPAPLILERMKNLDMVGFLKEHSEEIAKEIFRCHKHSQGKKAVVLPLSFKNKAKGSGGGSHANALVFNTLQMTAEHFEPHGIRDYVPARKGWLELVGVNLAGGINAINKSLKKVAKEKGFPKAFSSGLKYIKPVDVCPSESMYKNFKGVQGNESSKKPVDFEGFTIKEKSGYCQLWTYFLLDLRLKTLDQSPQEVLKEYATYRDKYKISIKENPNKTMSGLIRGYSKNYFNMIRKLINEGKFSLEEFLKYRDWNDAIKNWKKMSEDEKKTLRDINKKVEDSLIEEATKKMEKVMKDAQK
tara:strand:- start:71 stop:2095 length:2025 start_codon:yes stop_codon:yes gene_type:complete